MEDFNPDRIQISVDVLQAALCHLDFLKDIDSKPYLQETNILQKAIERYEKFWLSLAAKHEREFLAAPIDIEWIWHCHMLCPRLYIQDCHNHFGKLIQHKLMNSQEREQSLKTSHCLWKEMYTTEPFDLNTDNLLNGQDGHTAFKSSMSYNLEEATKRQSEFYYQVSLPHYRDLTFLQIALLRYKKMLFLKKNNPDAFLVPCFDIDFIWHTHQLHPEFYKSDTEMLLGKVFNHDDSVSDRIEISKLSRADVETRELWKTTFKEQFSMHGAMYRGRTPKGKLHILSSEDINKFCSKRADVTITKVDATMLNEGQNSRGSYELVINVKYGSLHQKTVCKLSGSAPKWSCSESFVYDSADKKHLTFELYKKRGWPSCCQKELLGSDTVEDLINYIEAAKASTCLKLSGSSQKIEIECDIVTPQRSLCLLYLDQGEYKLERMSVDNEHIWGPIPLHSIPPETDNICTVASHRMKNHINKTFFICRIIHSVALMTSAVHVFYQDKMAAVSHTIGSDQLPLPTQTRLGITLNPKVGERAMLIKNHGGDWGLVIGKWTGVQKGTSTKYDSAGYLQFTFYNLCSKTQQTIDMDYERDIFSFRVNGVHANLETGEIQIDSNCDEPAEGLALVFSVAMLHVLCVPRPKNWKPGESLIPKNVKRGAREFKFVPSEDLVLVMACGLLVLTPSNHYLYHEFGHDACAGCGDSD